MKKKTESISTKPLLVKGFKPFNFPHLLLRSSFFNSSRLFDFKKKLIFFLFKKKQLPALF